MSEITDGTTVSSAISSSTKSQAIESQAEAEVIETKKSDVEGKISTAKSGVTDGEKNKAEIEDKLATPAPQENGEDKKGGASTNAVDPSEQNQLKAELNVEEGKIQEATNEVVQAHVDLSELESALSGIKIDTAELGSSSSNDS